MPDTDTSSPTTDQGKHVANAVAQQIHARSGCVADSEVM